MTTGSPVIPFVDAVKAALEADAPLMALVTGIHGATARGEATTLPYVRLGRRGLQGDGFAMQLAGGVVSLQVDVWSGQNGAYEASAIVGHIRRVLLRSDLPIAGFALMGGSITCEMEEIYQEPDTDMPDRTLHHGVQRWLASIEDAA